MAAAAEVRRLARATSQQLTVSWNVAACAKRPDSLPRPAIGMDAIRIGPQIVRSIGYVEVDVTRIETAH